MIGWKFPLNNDGDKDGLNDSGIETFKGVPYESLAREVIQNSLDAADPDKGAPVEVHFKLYNMPKNIFPGADEFTQILQACKKEKPDHQGTQKFFDVALSVIASDEMQVIKISDFNTTGLLNSFFTIHSPPSFV